MSEASKKQGNRPSSRASTTTSRRSDLLQEVRDASEEMLRVTRAAAKIKAQKAKLIAAATAQEEQARAELDRANGEAAAGERKRAADAAAALESQKADLEEEEQVLQAEGQHAQRILDVVTGSFHESAAGSWEGGHQPSIADRTSAWAANNFREVAETMPTPGETRKVAADVHGPTGAVDSGEAEEIRGHTVNKKVSESVRCVPERRGAADEGAVEAPRASAAAGGEWTPPAADVAAPAAAESPGQTLASSDDNKDKQLIERVCQVITNVSSGPFYDSQLPVFSGDPIEFIAFKAIFEQSTAVGKLSQAQNLLRLQKALKGKAREAVSGLLLFPTQVDEILKTLEILFGNANAVINRTLNEVRKMHNLSEDLDQEALTRFACKIKNMIATLKALERNDHLMNPDLLASIIAKLPKNLLMTWVADKDRQTSAEPVVCYFARWLEALAISSKDAGICHMENKKYTSTPFSRERRNRDIPSKKKEYVFSSSGKSADTLKCPRCEGKHYLSKCEIFKKHSLDERWAFVRENKKCYKCLAPSHGKGFCPAYRKNPRTKYHYLLTNASMENKNKNGCESDANTDTEPSTSQHIVANTVAKNNVLLKVLPVVVIGPKGKKTIYALADECSTVSLLDQAVADELGLDGPTKPLDIYGVSEMSATARKAKNVNFRIRGAGESRTYDIHAYSLNQLNLPCLKSIPPQYVNGQKGGLNLVSDITTVRPQLLIGANCWKLIISRGLATISKGVSASKTLLGWVAVGNVAENGDNEISHSFCVSVNDGEHDHRLEELLEESIRCQEIWPEKQRINPEIARAENLLQSTTVQCNGTYTTGLLWRQDSVIMPENYHMANTRLRAIEKKMDRNAIFADAYCQQINRYVTEGYVCEVSEEELKGRDNIWFLPHFGVENPTKPGKLRIVFDGAATWQGTSLNNCLLDGPNLYNSITGMLFKFRENPVAFSADIKDFFLRIKISENDSYKQLFLWRGKERVREPQKFRVTSLIFGSRSSPCSAQYVRNTNAARFAARYPDAAEAIKNNHYVDDLLYGADTIANGRRLIQEINWIHKQGGFQLTNWAANDDRVLVDIPMERRAGRHVALIGGESDIPRVLGMYWLPLEDELAFDLRMHRVDEALLAGARTPTKREILKIIMSVYDPLGYLAILTVKAKIIMQKVWQSRISWDKRVNEEITKDWRAWLAILNETAKVRIPRYYGTARTPDERREIHVFCDASTEAMCACAYLRIIKPGAEPIVRLIGSRTRVAPLKVLSVPRLELTAGLLGAQLCHKIRQEHTLEIHEQVFWSDSRNLIWWVRSQSSDHQQFVSNRLGVIDELSQPKQWRWLSGKVNPADDATRLNATADMSSTSRWFGGPGFLRLDREFWPDEVPDAPSEKDRAGLEYRPAVTLHIHEGDKGILQTDRFSNHRRMVRAMAYVQKFIDLCRKKTQDRRISGVDIAAAEIRLIKDAQRRSFGKDMERVKNGESLPVGSRIQGLNAFVDDDGLLRLGSRIGAAVGVPYNTKYPMIIEGKDRLTTLLIKRRHEENMHAGVESILSVMREHFWMINPRRSVKKEIFNCLQCRLKRAKPVTALMGNLPLERLAHHTKPFSHTGLDTFGPMKVTVGRRRELRYGVIFTCLSVRAIHVEVMESLTTDSMMQAIRRFVARRGMPQVFYSDNATNMHGSCAELRRATSSIDHDKLKEGVK